MGRIGIRKYEKPPYHVVVVHGGPGACGEMGPVARVLARKYGVLEPMQSALSVGGQREELKGYIEHHAVQPCIVIGYSWGAWLVTFLASTYPHLVKKVILVSSGPFDDTYAEGIMKTRRERLSSEKQAEVDILLKEGTLSDVSSSAFHRFGQLMSEADTFCALDSPEDESTDSVSFDPEGFAHVWPEAASLRRDGTLLRSAREISCPVTAIHGDYDPHPAEGVSELLSQNVSQFTFHLLTRCGHTPWKEKHARDAFFSLLLDEITRDITPIAGNGF